MIAATRGEAALTLLGFSTDELARNGRGSPMHTLLNKPFTLPDLVGFVERAFAATNGTEA